MQNGWKSKTLQKEIKDKIEIDKKKEETKPTCSKEIYQMIQEANHPSGWH